MKLSKTGWGGRIRTYDTRYQKPMPYHLAAPHHETQPSFRRIKHFMLKSSDCTEHQSVINRENILTKSMVINEKIS